MYVMGGRVFWGVGKMENGKKKKKEWSKTALLHKLAIHQLLQQGSQGRGGPIE